VSSTDLFPHVIDTGGADAIDVLCLHGLGGNAAYWDGAIESPAAPMPIRQVAWTMPGYGPSPALATTTIATLADAALAVLDQAGIQQAVVVGHSMGGFIAQQLAAAHPERVAGLVLVATTAVFGKPGSDFNERFLKSRLAPIEQGLTPADFAAEVAAGLVGPQADPSLIEAAGASMAKISAAGYRNAVEALVQFDGRALLPTLAMPVLAIAGSNDATASAGAMQHIVDLVPNGRLEVIANVGHLVNLEAPDEFRSLVTGFLTELTESTIA